MALSAEDRQEIRQTVQDAVTSSVGPLVAKLQALETRLYGQGQDPGDVGDLRRNISGLFRRMNRSEMILAAMLGVGGLGGGTFAIIKLFVSPS